jgi:hypothetical protein
MKNKKNIVFMFNIKINNSKLEGDRWLDNRSDPYIYSVKSWQKWCDKNNAELFVIEDLLLPNEDMAIPWQKFYIFDILEANDIEYDQIMYVDADTIVHPDCPNVFEKTDGKYTFVHNEGSYDWILRSMENYSKYFFDGYMFDWWHYYNAGLEIYNGNHKDFAKKVIEFYNNNKENLMEIERTFHGGTVQTPVNFLIHLENIDYKLLPYEYNMADMVRKEILREDLAFTKCGWVYHFSAIPNNKNNVLTNYWMKKTYEHLYG